MANSKYTRRLTKHSLWLLLLLPFVAKAQDSAVVLSLDTILQRIDQNNILLQSYGLKAQSYRYSAEASTAWMPPMAGLGTFMTPYPNQIVMDGGDRGSLMLQIEQDIPNPSKLRSKKKYIESQANIETANRAVTLNDLKAQAKRLYYNWVIAKNRIKVLSENERTMLMMKKIEEVRYPYNQSQLGSVYKIEAKVEENKNMLRMQESLIAKSRAWLNALMNAPGNTIFEIDSIADLHYAPSKRYDTADLASTRKDVLKMNESIRSMQLNIQSMQQQRKPDFRVRFDHMYPLDAAMPNAFNVMGMISIPIAPWSSKMYKSDIKAMRFNIEGMQKERIAMLQETQGMLYGMQQELQSMHDRVMSMEEKIIPALQKAFDANFIQYQENKLALTAVLDSWEALNMMEINLLDEKLKHYEMIVDYEKELYR